VHDASRLVCSNTAKTVKNIEDNAADNWNISNPVALATAALSFSAQLNIPAQGSPAADDVSICSRPWRWEWFALFFQFAIVASALVVTLMPSRLLRSRYPLAIMFAIATAIIMVSCLQPLPSWRVQSLTKTPYAAPPKPHESCK
jgi:hypothetical protein